MQHRMKHSSAAHVIAGGAVMLLGTTLLLDNFGLVDSGLSWRWWPLLLIGLGAVNFFEAESPKKRGEAVWLAFIGAWLLVSFVHLWGLTFATSWPILLVGAGVGMIWRASHQDWRGGRAEAEVRHEA